MTSEDLWLSYAKLKHTSALDAYLDAHPELLALGVRCCATKPTVPLVQDTTSKVKRKTKPHANTNRYPKRNTPEKRS